MRKKIIAGLILSTISISSFADANQVLNLSLILGKACYISAPNTMPFGDVTSLFAMNGTQIKSVYDNINILCNRALVYSIGILPVTNSDLVKATDVTAKYPNIFTSPRRYFTKLSGSKPGNSDNLYIDWYLDSTNMNLADNEAAVRNFKVSYVSLGFPRSHVLETRLNNYGRPQFPTTDNYSTTMRISVDY